MRADTAFLFGALAVLVPETIVAAFLLRRAKREAGEAAER